MKRGRLCAYCGAPATTKDHIPPKKLFPQPRSSDLITVPACEACNNAASTNDEYFVWAVTMHVQCGGEQSARVVQQRLTPPVPNRRRRAIEAIQKGLRPINVTSPGGIYLGQVMGFETDRRRLNAVVERCVRGLYFREFGTRVPDALGVLGLIEPPPSSAYDPAVRALMNNAQKSSGEGVFEYWLKKVEPEETKGVALCLLRFFGGLVALGFVLPKETIDEAPW